MIYSTLTIDAIDNKFNNGELVRRDMNPYYRNERGVRKANLSFLLTDNEMEEYVRCSSDYIYFIENYCKIDTKSIKLCNYQREYLDNVAKNKFILHVKSREVGTTLLYALNILHNIIFNNDKIAQIISETTETSIEIIEKIKNIYINLPFFLKPGVINWNQSSIRFDNGSRVIGQSIKNASIGFTVDYIIIENFAHIPHDIISTYYNLVYPLIAATNNSKMIISSTPNGFGDKYNLFYDLYLNSKEDAEPSKKNNFKLIETPYTVIENRGSDWVEERIKIFGKDLFEQEYNLKFLNKNINEHEEVKKIIKNNVNPIIDRLDKIEKLLLEILNKK